MSSINYYRWFVQLLLRNISTQLKENKMNSKKKPLVIKEDTCITSTNNINADDVIKKTKQTKWNKRLAKVANKFSLSLMVNFK